MEIDLNERFPSFFDIDFIKSRSRTKKGDQDKLIIDKLLDPANERPIAPNAIFNPKYYAAQCNARGYTEIGNPIVHFLELGDLLGLRPNPLFDPEHYRRRNGLKRSDSVNSVNHALSIGFARRHDFHPLLDLRFSCRQLQRTDYEQFTLELFAGSLVEKFDPHPLFSISFLENVTGQKFGTVADAIDYYLASEIDLSTHYLFDVDYYRERAFKGSSNLKGLIHFLSTDGSQSPHPLFDAEYYRRSAYKKTGQVISRPLEHFVQYGGNGLIDASPYFNLQHYRRVVGLPVEPYHHYLAEEGFRFHSPHPLIDVDDYALLNGYSGGERLSEVPAIDFALHPKESKPVSIAFFDPKFYREHYTDLAQVRSSMMEHYFSAGLREGRYPNALFSEQYVLSTVRKATLTNEKVVEYYFNARMHERKRILYVLTDTRDIRENHNAISMLRYLGGLEDVELITLVMRKGPLWGQLIQNSHVYLLQENYDSLVMDVEAAEREISKVFQLLGANRPIIAFCDGVESFDVAKLISNRNVPVVSMLRDYDRANAERIADIAASSAEVTFPARYMIDDVIEQAAVSLSNLSAGGTFVAEFMLRSANDRAWVRSTLREALGLDEGAFVIFGSGGLDLGSGVDDFGTTARLFCERYPEVQNVHFVWKGKGPDWPNTPYFYANQEMRLAGFADRLHFADDTVSYEDLYQGSDIYFLPVRLIALPINILFAKGYGLPIVTNDSQTAASEFAGVTSGLVYAERDLGAAAASLYRLFGEPEFHAEMSEKSLESYRAEWSSSAAQERYTSYLRAHALQKVRGLARKKDGAGTPHVFSNGRKAEYTFAAHALKHQKLTNAKQIFIGGRFESDIADLISGKSQRSFDVYQPAGPEKKDRLETLTSAITECNMNCAVFVDLDDLLTEKELSKIDAKKVLVISDERTNLRGLYKHGLRYDEIWLGHQSMIDKMRSMNPLIADRMILIQGNA